MTVISTTMAFKTSTLAMSEIEYKLYQMNTQVLALKQQASEYSQQNADKKNDTEVQNTITQLTQQEQAIQAEIQQLSVEYNIYKERLEVEKNMQNESIKRTFKPNLA